MEARLRDDIPAKSLIYARIMRREPTQAEKKLWYAFRDRRLQGLKFRRQHPLGPYIADFACIAHNLIIEADGSQHAESVRDARRDAFLNDNGFKVLRFSNYEILTNQEGVLATIAAACGLPW